MSKKAAEAANMAEMDTLQSFGDRPRDALSRELDASYDFEEQFKQDSTAYYYVN